MKLRVEDVPKLKVKDIRKELALRGLDQSGTKALLISRLTESISKEPQTEPPSGAEPTSKAPAKQPETDENEEEELDDGEIKPKHAPIVYNLAQKDSAQLKADDEEKKKRRVERFGPVTSGGSDAKRMRTKDEKVAQKLPETEKAKMESRAKRFGTTSSNGDPVSEGLSKEEGGLINLSHIVSSSSITEDEKMKRRTERFGPVSK